MFTASLEKDTAVLQPDELVITPSTPLSPHPPTFNRRKEREKTRMTEAAAKEPQSFTGSCHCGFFRYRVKLAVPEPPEVMKATRCNCSICHKTAFTGVSLASHEDFELLSPASFDEVNDYQWRSKTVHRYFCPKCGVNVYGCGQYEFNGKTIPFSSLNALTLDQEQMVGSMDMTKWKMEYFDGKNDNWLAGTKDVPWAQGCV